MAYMGRVAHQFYHEFGQVRNQLPQGRGQVMLGVCHGATREREYSDRVRAMLQHCVATCTFVCYTQRRGLRPEIGPMHRVVGVLVKGRFRCRQQRVQLATLMMITITRVTPDPLYTCHATRVVSRLNLCGVNGVTRDNTILPQKRFDHTPIMFLDMGDRYTCRNYVISSYIKVRYRYGIGESFEASKVKGIVQAMIRPIRPT